MRRVPRTPSVFELSHDLENCAKTLYSRVTCAIPFDASPWNVREGDVIPRDGPPIGNEASTERISGVDW